MFVALYWAWNYTTWMANWFDPDTAPVRLVLVFVMAAKEIGYSVVGQGLAYGAALWKQSYEQFEKPIQRPRGAKTPAPV